MNAHRIVLLASNGDRDSPIEAVVWQGGEALRTSHLFAELERLSLDCLDRMFAVERQDSLGWVRYIWRGAGIRETAIEEEQRREAARMTRTVRKRKGGI